MNIRLTNNFWIQKGLQLGLCRQLTCPTGTVSLPALRNDPQENAQLHIEDRTVMLCHSPQVIRIARKSLTFVYVGPVMKRSPMASKKLYESCLNK